MCGARRHLIGLQLPRAARCLLPSQVWQCDAGVLRVVCIAVSCSFEFIEYQHDRGVR